MESLLEVGQIVNSYGIKGFLKVVPLVDNNNQFKEFKRLYVQEKNTYKELKIEEIKFSKNLVLIKAEGIDTIEIATKFKNLYLFAKRVLKAKLRRLSTIFPRKLPVYYQIV